MKVTKITGDGKVSQQYINDSVTFYTGGNMGITPLYDRVLIKPSKPEEVSSGGIIIPDTAREGSIRGEVIAVGEGRLNQDGTITPLKVKVGDSVIYSKNKFDASNIVVDGQEFVVMREMEIIGIVQ
jgi:chaperonin GroES